MAQTINVFVCTSSIASDNSSALIGAISEVNKIYALEGSINFALLNVSAYSAKIGRKSLTREILKCQVAIFIADYGGIRIASPAFDFSSASLLKFNNALQIALERHAAGTLKYLAVFSSQKTLGKFIMPTEDRRSMRLEQMDRALKSITDERLIHPFSSSTDLATSIVGLFARWRITADDPNVSLDAIPEQSNLGLMFGGDPEAPLGLFDPPSDRLLSTPDQQSVFSDIRERAELLLIECENSNRLAVLRSYAARLIDTMGATVAELKVLSFWSAMNSLRRRSEADERLRTSVDPDDLPLPENVAGILLDLVDNLNLFRAFQPRLAALDELSQDPMSRISKGASISAARRISDNAASHRMAVTQEAASRLQDTILEATGNSTSSERAKEFSVRSARNLSLEAVRRVYSVIRAEPRFAIKEMRAGVYRQLGTSITNHLGSFLVGSETDIMLLFQTLGSNPALQDIFNAIIQFFK